MKRAVIALAFGLTCGCYASHGPDDDGGGIVTTSPVTEPCITPGGGSRRDCGFRVERVVSCRSGTPQVVGCGCEGLGRCSGDPVLRICDRTRACRVDEAIDNVDDRCGLCPSVDFLCPPSGQYTILSAPFGGSPYSCEVEVRGGG